MGKELLLKYFVEFQRNATSDEICISMGKERPAGAYLYGIDHEVNERNLFFFAGEEKFINEINPAERFWWTTPVSKIFSGGNKKFAIELPIFTRIPWLNRLFKREIQIENQVECDILSRLMAVHE